VVVVAVRKAPLVAPAAFLLVMLALGAVTPGYNALSQFGSNLSLGPLGWVMILNFVVLGLVETVCGAALFRAVGPARSGRLGAAMVTLIGLAFTAAGVFVTDPQGARHTVHGVIHVLMAVVLFFFAFPIGGVAMAVRWRAHRALAVYSAATAVASPALLVATFLSGDLLGLVERILIAVTLAWLTVVAARHQRPPAAGTAPAAG
jgi:hypothetical membrane protein